MTASVIRNSFHLLLILSLNPKLTNTAQLPINPKIIHALNTMNFNNMSSIQLQSIPECLSGNDLVGAAKTGSGKTLAYMIPAVELLRKGHCTNKNGTGVLIITPTRELAMQNYKWARDLL